MSNEPMDDAGAVHVTPHEGRWAVRSDGSDQPELTFPNRLDAVLAAREAAQTAGLAMLYHGPTGNVVYREEFEG